MAGFGLLFALIVSGGEDAGFFLLLFLVVMLLLRMRIPRLKYTVYIDIIVCLGMLFLGNAPLQPMTPLVWQHAPYAIVLPLFGAMYLGVYPAVLAVVLVLLRDFQPALAIVLVLGLLSGLFLRSWNNERKLKLTLRDKEAEKYYALESLQVDLSAALTQVERMASVSERARISRDIHDNAGHEIVAAYITLQTLRDMLEGVDPEVLSLYDAAVERLSSGTDKIREAVHNMSTVKFLGVESLRDICDRFPSGAVVFNAFGDSTKVPMYIWAMLESCLSESLTNAVRHAQATWVKVDLDVTAHIVRLCIENDGVSQFADRSAQMGNGLRNLRHRAGAVGGSLAVDSGEVFRVICVIPIKDQSKEQSNEIINR